jgi:NitT/TauT family transport system ATP-binding protein
VSTITLSDVSKVFQRGSNKTVALENSTLSIDSGETVCLVGPSGCGKTTILNLVAGFLEPTTGSVTVDEKTVHGPSEERAVVFQADAVFPWLTVEKNIAFGPRVQGKSKEEQVERTERFMGLVGLSDFREAFPKELSGGMRKRVDLARAYASGPKALLLDEPFGALDVFTKETMWLAFQKVAEAEPKTVVFVTHDIEEALFLGDRVVVMTPRPARVHRIVDVPFGQKRDLEIRATSEFQELRQLISRSLREVHGDN